MAIPAGTYRFGPDNSTLSVRTGRTGAAAKAGHNLLFHVTLGGHARGRRRPESRAERRRRIAAADRGHRRPAVARRRRHADIAKTIDNEVLERQAIAFRSTQVAVAPTATGCGEGELTLRGTTGPLGFDVVAAGDGTLSAVATVKQTEWKIKPYSALFGALKVVDEVEVSLDAAAASPLSRV